MNEMNYDTNQQDTYDPGQKKGFRWIFLAAAAVVLTAAVVTAVLGIGSGVKTGRYNKLIRLGNACYSSGKYQEAIENYQSALKITGEKTEAYLNLSTVYMAMHEYKKAEEILTEGLAHVTSQELEDKLVSVKTLSNTEFADVQTKQLTHQEIEEASAEITIQNETFDKIAAYTYTEYYRDLGEPSNKTKEGNRIILNYDVMNISAVYYDLDHEKVLDLSGEMPIAAAKPCEVQCRKLSLIFGSNKDIYAVSRAKLEEFFGESAEFYQDPETEKYYIRTEYKGCRLTAETNEAGDIVSETAWNMLEPLSRTKEETVTDGGKISGYVQNAMTGQGMNATLKIREKGVKAGNAIREIKAGADGSYSYEQKAGNYTVEVSAAGFVTEYIDVEILEGQVKTGINIVLSPTVGEGEIRIVLTWGAYPGDLDSHTTGTSSAGQNFHVFFAQKSQAGVANLDVDDINGYGPETTTITDAGASFDFYVQDFTESGEMSASDATVKVYLPQSAAPEIFTVPAGSGNIWNVFRYANGVVTPVNTRE